MFAGTGTALFAQLVFSTSAAAKLLTLDPAEALAMPGVHEWVAAKDVPAMNCVNGKTGRCGDPLPICWHPLPCWRVRPPERGEGCSGLTCSLADRAGPIGKDNLLEKIFFEAGDTIPSHGVGLGLIIADTWKQVSHGLQL